MYDDDYNDAPDRRGGLEVKRRGAVRAMDQLEKSIEQLRERIRTLEEHIDPFLKPDFPRDSEKVPGGEDREPSSSMTVRLESAATAVRKTLHHVDELIERVD